MGERCVSERARQLGRDVRLLRLSWNLTQAEVAALAGVSLRSVKDLERGAATLRTLVRVILRHHQSGTQNSLNFELWSYQLTYCALSSTPNVKLLPSNLCNAITQSSMWIL